LIIYFVASFASHTMLRLKTSHFSNESMRSSLLFSSYRKRL